MTNYSSGHETRVHELGELRLAFPDDHIEVDNRLVWFMGAIQKKFPTARYVHLMRDPESVALSYNRRWHLTNTIVRAWKDSILMGLKADPLQICRDFVSTVNQNIEAFLADKPHMVVRLENINTDFPEFWRWSGAEGDLTAAMAEWPKIHNSGARERARLRKTTSTVQAQSALQSKETP